MLNKNDWKDCIVIFIDLCGVKGRKDGSTLMRKLHKEVSDSLNGEKFSSIDHVYVWNDSVLLISFVSKDKSSFESAMQDAEKLKCQIDKIAKNYAIAVKGRAFPAFKTISPPKKNMLTVIKASSWAMANCFIIEEALKSSRAAWYIDGRIVHKLRRISKDGKSHKVSLLPSNTKRSVYTYKSHLFS